MTLNAMRGIYWSISTFGLHVFYRRRWGIKQEDMEPHNLPTNIDPLSLRRSTWKTSEWTRSVASMSAMWRFVLFACGILLPLSIAFLQVNGVADNVRTRTFTLASSVFASSGLLCSGLYLCEDSSRFCNRRLTAKWIEASRNPRSAQSIEFWALLALPLTSLICSTICCVCTTLAVSWMKTNSNGSGTENDSASQIDAACIICPIILTSIIFICIIQIGRAMKVFSSA